jgi:hypothetical protein
VQGKLIFCTILDHSFRGVFCWVDFPTSQSQVVNSQAEELKAQKIQLLNEIQDWIKNHQSEFEICLEKAIKKIQQIKPIYQSLVNKSKQTGKDLIQVVKESTVYSSWVFEEVKAML